MALMGKKEIIIMKILVVGYDFLLTCHYVG